MPDRQSVYTVSYKVRSYEVDYLQEATIASICDYFQEAAGRHAKELNVDITDLHKKGFTWILYKMQVKVHRFPYRWETVRVTTWPSTGEGIRAYRDYQLHSENDECLAEGLSQWMILDVKRRRPVKIPDKLLSEQYKTGRHVLELHKTNLEKLEGVNAELIAKVGLNDLDMNRHVNNVKYVDWLTGYRNSDKLNDKKCRELIVQFADEAKYRDNIFLSNKPSKSNKNEIVSSLFKNDSRRLIANSIATWS